MRVKSEDGSGERGAGSRTQRTMIRSLLVCCLLPIAYCLAAFAAPPDDASKALQEVKAFRAAEAQRVFRTVEILRRAEAAGVQASQGFDIQHWDLDLRVIPAARTIAGTVTMSFEPTQSLSKIKMRLYPRLKASGATLDGVVLKVKRDGANLTFNLAQPLQPGTTHDLAVTYSGTPVVTGGLGGGMMFGSHDGTPSATTLSEPFDSYAWWPCVDDVKDKATMTMRLTVPAGMTGASNGTLDGVTANGDGTLTYTWSENYPLSNYLISANVTNYSTSSDHYQGLDGTTSMPIDYFVYPEGLANSMNTVQRVPDMIAFFANLAGEYPFLNEKYGMVTFPWGGGMEHQTLTSMGDAYLGGGTGDYDGIYAHELAHMWWGDAVTCATWNDIWLNEGFATYYEMLWLVHHYQGDEGDFMSQYYDDGAYDGYLGGAVYRKNGNQPFADTGAIYEKGAWVLHMLKGVMGEDSFDRALRRYRAAHALGVASTADLRAACEAQYGHPLDWFFDQWVYTPKRPIYRMTTTQGVGQVTVVIEQRQPHKVANRTSDRDVYTMWVPLWFHYSDGSSEIRTVWNNQRSQSFNFAVSKPLESVGLDEGHTILKTLQ